MRKIIVCLFCFLLPSLAQRRQDLFSCGKTDNPLRLSVSSKVGLWPWIGSLGFQTSSKWNHQCGATLLSHTILITAAHCGREVKKKTVKWKVRLGDYNLADPSDDVVAVDRDILEVFIHPLYDDWLLYFDIAVLIVEPIKFTIFVRPVCLPVPANRRTDLNRYDGKSAIVLGWGRESSFQEHPNDLHRVFLTVYDYNFCNSSHLNSGGAVRATVQQYLPDLYQPHVLCAGNEASSDGSCDGDSGGPILLFNTRSSQYTLIGTVAGGLASKCGDHVLPGVYIRLDHPEILNWITRLMEDYSQEDTDSEDTRMINLGEKKVFQCGNINGPVIADQISSRLAIPSDENQPIWPWMVSIGELENDKWNHKCGGSLVTEKFILSASHCFSDSSHEDWLTRLGLSLLSEIDENVVTRRIRHVSTHPKHDGLSAYYDVAIVLIEPVEFSDRIGTVCLPTKSSPDADKYMNWATTLAGWGSQFKNGAPSATLTKAQLTIFDSSYCNKTHSNTGFYLKQQVEILIPNLIQPHLFCAGSDGSGFGSCEGDSGGPLVSYNPTKAVYTQLGLVVGGIGECADVRFPGIYVRVDHPEIFDFINGILLEEAQTTPSQKNKEKTTTSTTRTTTKTTTKRTTTRTTTTTSTTTDPRDRDCAISSFGLDDPKQSFLGICFGSSPKRGKLVFKNGDSYFGSLENGKFTGHGTVVYSSSDRLGRVSYEGDFKSGKRHGEGKFVWSSGSVYDGSYVNDARIGFGTLTFGSKDPLNRLKYEGEWRNGSITGQGKLLYKNGDKYEGSFDEGNLSGFGTFKWTDGREYKGQYVKGKMTGNGTMVYPPNDPDYRLRYEGKWHDGKWNGTGKLTLNFGDTHEGLFIDNVAQGIGTYTSASGDKFFGQWKDGKANGFGLFYYSQNNSNLLESYEGEWLDNKKHGNGILAWAFGDRYEGEFVNDVADGTGTYFWVDGRKYVGQFTNNSNEGQGVLYFVNEDVLGRKKYEGQWVRNPNFKESTFNGGVMSGYGTFTWADGTQYVGQFRNDSPHGRGTTLSKDGSTLQEGFWANGKFVQ